MYDRPLKVLLIEDDAEDVLLVRDMLREEPRVGKIDLEVAHRLSAGMERLRGDGVDAVLLDLGLPDSSGLETLARLLAAQPALPVVVLTGLDDETVAMKALEEGAQDYLVKGECRGRLLARCVYHAVARKRAEDGQELAASILDGLNRSYDPLGMIPDVLDMLSEFTGFDAVGFRLQEGDDYPYLAARGFSDGFQESENSLCVRDSEGKVVRDEHGRARLECVCGAVLTGRCDPALPFFTGGGSFWTNGLSELLPGVPEGMCVTRLRGWCKQWGYESVALIPLWSRDEVVGLLHLMDKRPHQLTQEMTRFLEGIAASIGIALARSRSEGRLRRYAERLKALHEIDEAVLAADSLGAVARSALKSIWKLISCARASIVALEPHAREAIVIAVQADGGTKLGTGVRVPVETFGTPEEIQRGSVRLVEDILDLEHKSRADEVLLEEGIRSYISVPLMAEGEPVGFLNLGGSNPGAFSSEHCDIALELADILGIAIHEARTAMEVQENVRQLERRLARQKSQQ